MTKSDLMLIHAIAKRARAIGVPSDQISTTMDIEYTHAVNPIHLHDLLNASNADFAHDVFGIYNNFNRETRKLDNCFSPRFSK